MLNYRLCINQDLSWGENGGQETARGATKKKKKHQTKCYKKMNAGLSEEVTIVIRAYYSYQHFKDKPCKS